MFRRRSSGPRPQQVLALEEGARQAPPRRTGAWQALRGLGFVQGLLRTAVFGLGAVYAVSLLPGVRAGPGFLALPDGWANTLFIVGIIALLVLRGAPDRPGRRAWWCLAAALTAYLAGSLGYYMHYRLPRPPLRP